MSGLFASLALSAGVASSMLGGGGTADVPDVEDQTPVVEQAVDQEQDSQGTMSSSDSVSSEWLEGVDIASHQHGKYEIDLDTLLNSGTQNYGFVKATEGISYVNPHFRDDAIKYIDNNVPVGFYHYAKPSDSTADARKQARIFLSVTGITKGVKSLDPVLDIEENKEGLSSQQLIDWTQAFVDEIKEKSGRDVMIYTYPAFWRSEMGNTTQFKDLPLWIAEYNNQDSPSSLPGGWDDWTFWQYTSQGAVPGYDTNIDVNVFRGTADDLDQMYKSSKVSKKSHSASSSSRSVAKAPTI